MTSPAASPQPATTLAPPRAFRSDTVGIFAVLLAAGVGNLLLQDENSLDDIVHPVVAGVWAVTLVVFGAVGLVSCLLPRRMVLLALGLELSARIALGFGALTYGTAVVFSLGLTGRTVVAVATFVGIGLLHFAAARTIVKWLRARRRQVTSILAVQDERHEREDRER